MALREFAAQELWRIMGFDEVDEIMLTIDEIMLTIGGPPAARPTGSSSPQSVYTCVYFAVSACGGHPFLSPSRGSSVPRAAKIKDCI